jgi:CBS-domain-containing membrane protein
MAILTVAQVMTGRVISVRQETPFKELVRLMKTHGVSGLPVLDSSGCLVGIVTEADLLEHVGGAIGEKKRHSQLGRLIDRLLSPTHSADVSRATANLSARSLMTSDVITTTPETPVREAARHIVESGVKRLPVIDDDKKVVGIVSRQDLLRPYLLDDERIREEVIEDLVKRVLWMDPEEMKVIVNQGVVKLHGVVAKQSQREILVELTGRVDGVVQVEDHMTAAENDRDFEPDWMHKESPQAEPWAKVAQLYGYSSTDKR